MSRFHKNVSLIVAAAWLAVGLTFAAAVAQESAPAPEKKAAAEKLPAAEKRPGKGSRSAAPAAMPAFTPKREAAAMKFVREHHPEVADLLDHLRTSRPEQYRRAARELFRSSERVSQWKERDAARYELELKAWKINSRVQLLLARSTMSLDADVDADVEAELKSLLAERIETRLALRRLDREQLEKRLAAANADIARLSGDKDAAVERQLAQMRQKIKASRQRVKAGGGKNAKKQAVKNADHKTEKTQDEK